MCMYLDSLELGLQMVVGYLVGESDNPIRPKWSQILRLGTYILVGTIPLLETRSQYSLGYSDQAGLTLRDMSAQSSECWDQRHVLPFPASKSLVVRNDDIQLCKPCHGGVRSSKNSVCHIANLRSPWVR